MARNGAFVLVIMPRGRQCGCVAVACILATE
jgi:hypothetical protein